MSKLNLLLADDHAVITQGLKSLLAGEDDIHIAHTCESGREALRSLDTLSIDVVLLDVDMPEMSGQECAEAIISRFPKVKIIMLTMHDSPGVIKPLLELGVHGYLLKTVERLELVNAIRNVAQGRNYFQSEVTQALIKPTVSNQASQIEELSSREIDVVKLVANGNTNAEIADVLHISPRTVDSHRTNIMRKLDIHNVAGITKYAFRNGLIE